MEGFFMTETLRSKAKKLEVTIRRSRVGLQLVDRYGHVFLGKQKGATVDEITERLDIIEKLHTATPDNPSKSVPQRSTAGLAMMTRSTRTRVGIS
jgi:hypothetical protein